MTWSTNEPLQRLKRQFQFSRYVTRLKIIQPHFNQKSLEKYTASTAQQHHNLHHKSHITVPWHAIGDQHSILRRRRVTGESIHVHCHFTSLQSKGIVEVIEQVTMRVWTKQTIRADISFLVRFKRA